MVVSSARIPDQRAIGKKIQRGDCAHEFWKKYRFWVRIGADCWPYYIHYASFRTSACPAPDRQAFERRRLLDRGRRRWKYGIRHWKRRRHCDRRKDDPGFS